MKLQILREEEWETVQKEVKVKAHSHFIEVYFDPNTTNEPRGNYRLVDGKKVVKKQIKFIS